MKIDFTLLKILVNKMTKFEYTSFNVVIITVYELLCPTPLNFVNGKGTVHNVTCYSSFSELVNNLNTFTTNCLGDFFGGGEGHFVSFNIQTNE